MDSSRIMQIGMGFWPAKTLLSAVELGVFAQLGAGPLTAEQLGRSLGLAPRAWFDFFDTLVALGLLEREGSGPEAHYRNGEEAATFLDRNRPTYMGGFLEMASTRLYRFWGDLSEGSSAHAAAGGRPGAVELEGVAAAVSDAHCGRRPV
jgi:hypothetical protein